MSLSREAFSLRETVARALVSAAAARRQGHPAGRPLAPDLPDQFQGDAARLGQVLANLAGNAVKFTPFGEVVVTVSPLRPPPSPHGGVAAGERGLRFEVTDTGIGIPADKQQAIFRAVRAGGRLATR